MGHTAAAIIISTIITINTIIISISISTIITIITVIKRISAG
jgi:hypothetical protein